jgi:hypothetical protein
MNASGKEYLGGYELFLRLQVLSLAAVFVLAIKGGEFAKKDPAVFA